MTQQLSYELDGADIQEAELLGSGQDITPLDWERMKPIMSWENWHQGFSELSIPGLVYQGCMFAVCYYRYAARGARDNPQVARSQAVVSEWTVEDAGRC